MTQDEIRALADTILRPILGPAGFTSSDVQPRPDHSGEESLYVTVHFGPGSQGASGHTLLVASVALQEALATRGDSRFPYFRYDYPDQIRPFDQDEAYGDPSDAAVS